MVVMHINAAADKEEGLTALMFFGFNSRWPALWSLAALIICATVMPLSWPTALLSAEYVRYRTLSLSHLAGQLTCAAALEVKSRALYSEC